MMTLDDMIRHVEEWGYSEYRRGLEEGLRVAERIVGWLTEQPDTPRQRRIREWAEKAIRDARMRSGLEARHEA